MDFGVEIAGKEYIVGCDITITASGSPESGPSYYSGGEPAESCEFEVEVYSLRDGGSGPELELPEWLRKHLTTYLSEWDKVVEAANQLDMERDYE